MPATQLCADYQTADHICFILLILFALPTIAVQTLVQTLFLLSLPLNSLHSENETLSPCQISLHTPNYLKVFCTVKHDIFLNYRPHQMDTKKHLILRFIFFNSGLWSSGKQLYKDHLVAKCFFKVPNTWRIHHIFLIWTTKISISKVPRTPKLAE